MNLTSTVSQLLLLADCSTHINVITHKHALTDKSTGTVIQQHMYIGPVLRDDCCVVLLCKYNLNVK